MPKESPYLSIHL
uniref:Uncharacterized protein n=1 Tax=Anguilla anguilla TaxID=7936 RepID=A0A0E9SYV6_ANGAN